MKNVRFNSGRIMLFTTVQNLQRLAQSKVFIMDGTFSSAPNGFAQIFTIHGSVGEQVHRKFLPFAHFLLPDKTEKTYRKSLKMIKNLAKEHKIRLDPDMILTDFEKAEIAAAQRVFKESTLKGCYFHFSKNLWKRLQKTGLTKGYNKFLKIQIAFRQTEALAFLPPEDVRKGLAALRGNAPRSMGDFFDYVDKVYVSGTQKVKRNGEIERTCPRYSPDFWSMKSNTENGYPRTSNSIEGFHNKFNRLIDKSASKFYAVVEAFRQEERSTSADYLRVLQDEPLSRTTAKNIKREQKLRKLVETYDKTDVPILEYLQAVALLLSKK